MFYRRGVDINAITGNPCKNLWFSRHNEKEVIYELVIASPLRMSRALESGRRPIKS